jgi:hypothetical protein
MLSGFNLNEIFMFPFKDEEARKHLLIGSLVSIAALVIPIVPYLVLFGYTVRLVRQVFNNEPLRMVPWEDWGGMFKDGLKMFGVRMIYSLPLMVIALPIFIASFVIPFIEPNNSGQDTFFVLLMAIMFGSFCLIFPLSILVAIFVPAAEMHMVEKDDFAAAFRVKEWLPIFRANLGGFVIAFVIYFIASMIMSLVFQMLMMTIILACLLPLLLPVMTIYLVLIMYVTIAQAYRDGKTKLEADTAVPSPA